MASPDNFDVTKQPMPGGGVNKPASGSYGDKANLDRLAQSFPKVDAPQSAGPGGMAPMPTPPSGGGVSSPPAPGLPSGLLAPTTRPDVPVSTPLVSGPPPNPVLSASTSRQRNMAILDALVADPTVSEATREWARINLQNLIQGSRR